MKLSGLLDLSVASICGPRVSRGVPAFEPYQCGRFRVHFPEGPVKKGKRGACRQKAATVLPNRAAAA